MHTAEYWLTEQAKLPRGATLVPIICGSDKTLLTTMAGNPSAWPVYLTIGNIPKVLRKKPSANAVLLLAILPNVPKGNNSASTRAGFHQVLTIVFELLKSVFSTGIDLDCANGLVRHCFLRLAAWMADTLEQSLMTCIVGGYCPICTAPKEKLGDQAARWQGHQPRHTKKQKNYDETQAQSVEDGANQEHSQVTFVQ